MKLIQKLVESSKQNGQRRPVTIAVLGDSVTQGCFELYDECKNHMVSVYDYQSVYHEKLKRMLQVLFPGVVIQVINAGIEGTGVVQGRERLERDVLSYNPDLVIVSFGLNDCVCGIENLESYRKALSEIIEEVQEKSCEMIFLTQNMMNTEVYEQMIPQSLGDFPQKTRSAQIEGILECFMESAKEICRDYNVAVCDCYSKWKKMYDLGIDTTHLLSNYINHPKRELHELFAYSLMETILNEN